MENEVRPAIIYGVDRQATTMNDEKGLCKWNEDVEMERQYQPYWMRWAVGVANISCTVTERRLKWSGHVRRRPLEDACRQIMDMKPPRKRQKKTEDTMDGSCGQRHDNGGSWKKDGGWEKTMTKNRQRPLRRPQITGQARGKEENCDSVDVCAHFRNTPPCCHQPTILSSDENPIATQSAFALNSKLATFPSSWYVSR